MAEVREHFVAKIDWTAVMRYDYPPACQVIRRLMPSGLRTIYDPEDFVADAIAELFARPDCFSARSSETLILVARRRMIDASRSPRSRTKRIEGDIIDPKGPAVLEHEAAELREIMLRRTADPGRRNLVELRFRGHTIPEIAQLTGLGLRKLQRFFKAFTEANEPY